MEAIWIIMELWAIELITLSRWGNIKGYLSKKRKARNCSWSCRHFPSNSNFGGKHELKREARRNPRKYIKALLNKGDYFMVPVQDEELVRYPTRIGNSAPLNPEFFGEGKEYKILRK